jgi:hypothetical protein
MKGFVLGALLLGASGTALARPELNAFINKPANSVPELLAQIKSDKQVADRFMRHFSMTKEEVLEFVGSLHLGTLKQSGYYTIYSAPDNGIIKAHISFFKKGTPAFVDADGNAVLRVKCANPFVRGPVKAYSTSEANVTDNPTDVDLIVAPETSLANGPMTTSFLPNPPEVQEAIAPITLKTTPINSSPNVFAGNPLASIIGIGGAASFIRRGNTNPVPEPASIIAITAGVGVLLRKRKKK